MINAREQGGGGKAPVSVDANEDYYQSQSDAPQSAKRSSSVVERQGVVRRAEVVSIADAEGTSARPQVIPALESPAS